MIFKICKQYSGISGPAQSVPSIVFLKKTISYGFPGLRLTHCCKLFRQVQQSETTANPAAYRKQKIGYLNYPTPE